MKRRRKLPDNVTSWIDRHGKERFRFRKTGLKTHCFKAHPGTPEFTAEYEAAKAGAIQPGKGRTAPGTIDDLVARYYGDPDFTETAESTQAVTRGILEAFRGECGAYLVSDFKTKHIEAAIKAKKIKRAEGKRKVGGASAAANLRKQLRRLFNCAVREEMIEVNPVDASRAVKVPKRGIHTWSEDEIARYQARHALGTRARLALEIMLWTGARRSDARLFGPSYIVNGKIEYTQAKTKKALKLPPAPQLLAAIRSMKSIGMATYLVTEFGKPFSKAGFGNKMRQWCDEAGLPVCTSHGLRKAIARRLADVGATQAQIKAVGGWSNDAEVALYTAGAEQSRMAEAAFDKLHEDGE